MIKVLIFDADGVLIQGERFSEKLVKEQGISLAQTAPFFNGPFEECLIGNMDLKDAVSPYLRGWGWDKGADAFMEYWFSIAQEIDHDLIAYIQDCRRKGIRCVVATNQEKWRADYMLNKLGFANSFDKLYASAHLRHKKPNLEFYAKLIQDLSGIEKEEILFWDDAPENVVGAKEFGIHAELYSSFDDFKMTMEKYQLAS